MRVNYVCSKWGTKYGPHFVNRLKNMARRNTPDQFDVYFYCYTDNAEGLDDDITVIPFPDIPDIHPKYWFGTEDFKYGMARCWDRPKTFVFNTHNFAPDNLVVVLFSLILMLLSNVTSLPSLPIT